MSRNLTIERKCHISKSYLYCSFFAHIKYKFHLGLKFKIKHTYFSFITLDEKDHYEELKVAAELLFTVNSVNMFNNPNFKILLQSYVPFFKKTCLLKNDKSNLSTFEALPCVILIVIRYRKLGTCLVIKSHQSGQTFK